MVLERHELGIESDTVNGEPSTALAGEAIHIMSFELQASFVLQQI